MLAAPRAAGASLPEAERSRRPQRLPAVRRLRSPAQFVAVTSDPQALRAVSRWLSVAGRFLAEPGIVPVRFGFTAARRLAPRAVDRNTVKRVMREAARAHIVALDAAVNGASADIVLRLKAAAPRDRGPDRSGWKAALRTEADSLLDQLARRLRAAGRR